MSVKPLVRIDHQIFNKTVDTESSKSFLNWPTAKQILESSDKVKFTSAERLNLPAQFVGYSEHPIVILGALRENIRSAGWNKNEATFLITERRTRFSSRTKGD